MEPPSQGVPLTTTVACRTRAFRVNTKKLAAVTDFVTARLGVAPCDVGVTLVGAAAIRALNRDFRGKDKSTDVLSFPQEKWTTPARVVAAPRAVARQAKSKTKTHTKMSPVPRALGDLVISLPDAEKNARSIGQPLDREVCFLIVHGLLHLCGHDHEAPIEEATMLAAQRRLMASLAKTPGGPLWAKSVAKRRSRA